MNKSIRHVLGAGVAAAMLASAFTVANAADDPASVLKYRKTLMSAIGAHMGEIGAIAKGQVSYGPEHVEKHATSIALMAGLIADAFKPEVGMDAGETAAKPNIWSNWSNFEGHAEETMAAAEKLAETAKGGDMAAIGAAVGALGKTCGGCHDEFREKKN